MDHVRIVLTTVGSHEAAEGLAGSLVERRLAACVNIVGPVRSIYRWEGAVERDQEFLLLIKTTEGRCGELATAVNELHPYDLPEFVELDVAGGSPAYLSWVVKQTVRDSQ